MSIFQDTAFGHLVRLVSGNKLLAWPEIHNEDLRLRYIYGDSKRPSDASSDKMEKGADYTVLEFLENHPQVCMHSRTSGSIVTFLTVLKIRTL